MSPNFHHGAVREESEPFPKQTPAVFKEWADLPIGQYAVWSIELSASS